jgi:hypothetical protein
MTRMWWRTAILCWIFVGALLLLIQGTAWDGQDLVAALSSADCSVPCFMGIQPGVTTGSVAYERLQTHAWIMDVDEVLSTAETLDQSREALFIWRWNGREPSVLRTPFLDAGEIDVQTGVVRSIKLRTVIPLGAVWLTFGKPGYGFTRLSKNYLGRLANQVAYYPERGIVAQTLIEYPPTADDFWNAPVDLFLTGGTPEGSSYESPCWMRCDE